MFTPQESIFQGLILEKPKDEADAFRMLSMLSGMYCFFFLLVGYFTRLVKTYNYGRYFYVGLPFFFLKKISFISIKKSAKGLQKCKIREYYIQKKWSGQGPGVLISL